MLAAFDMRHEGDPGNEIMKKAARRLVRQPTPIWPNRLK
jgi:hypothetical protein